MSLSEFQTQLNGLTLGRMQGRVTEIGPSYLYADGPFCAPGDVCIIKGRDGREVCRAEVVGAKTGQVTLMPLETAPRIMPNFLVELADDQGEAPVGDVFGNRMVDALGAPIDEQGALVPNAQRPLAGRVPTPLERDPKIAALETGIKAIDTLIPIAKGQRIGIFAASGVGKTTLVTQIARQTDCDRCILCLVGERGREVEAMWSSILSGISAAELTAVVATSDQPATMRVRAVEQALALAEYWRDQGEHVVIIVDSITRYAMALREVGLAAGAPPTMRAYTPNVFAALPRVVERCGAIAQGGSITGIFSVLSETDDVDDPIVEAMKSYLDGHILLSRELAESGQFPAIDIPRSISRLAPDLLRGPRLERSRDVVRVLSTYRRSRMLIESGMYQPGSDPEIDRAIALKEALQTYLGQGATERVQSGRADSQLGALMGDGRV